MIEKSNLLVMVPAFNEQASVRAVLEQLQVHGFHVVLISDGSTDATATIGRTCGVHVLELPINLGVGGALRAGFKFARRQGYLAVVQVDADGQHPVEEIEDLVRASNETGAHMVIGSRFIGDGSPMKVTGIRRVAMWVLARSASAAANERITDSTSGFRLIREPLLEQFSLQFANNYLGDTYESVVSAGRAGYRIIEIPAGLRERKNGESTASTGSAVRFTIKGLGVWMLGFHKKLARVEDASR
jgi:glycosyltransferase involved in cell wall biosynthesis